MPPQGTSANVCRPFWLSQLGEGTSDVQWAEARVTAKHPATHRTASTKNYLARNVSIAIIEKSGLDDLAPAF